MNQLKKTFLLLAVAVSLVLVGASTAAAQTCTTSSTPTLVRAEGTIEFLGKIDLNCTGITAIAASITVSIAPITATVAPGNAAPNNTSNFPFPAMTSTVVFGVAPTVSTSGNTATFSFTPGAGAQIITISAIRANVAASGLSGGAPLTALLTVSPTVAGQISITNPSLTVAFVSTGLTGTFGTAFNIPSCAPSIRTPIGSVAANPDLSATFASSLLVTLTEGFPTSWAVPAGEDGGTPGLQGTRFRIRLANIPTNIVPMAPQIVTVGSAAATGTAAPAATTIAITRVTAPNADGSGSAFIAAPVANTFDLITVTTGVATIVYEVTVTDATPVVNTITIRIALTGTPTTGVGTISGTIDFAPIGPPTTAASRPQFAARGVATSVATAVVCATYLLFPWVASTADGTFDTGFAIANTTADPSVIGTTGQTGDVTLYFWTRDGSTAPASRVIAAGLAPGRTAVYVLSGGGPGSDHLFGTADDVAGAGVFQGYVIAVCNFQLGHGFGFMNNPNPSAGAGSWAQGYLALSVTNPRLPAGIPTESTGH